MILRTITIVLAFAIVLSLPYALRPAREVPPPDALTLVVISPHPESIRYEFGQAFRQWHQRKYGRPVVIDWRVLGGTSEIARYLSSEYVAAFRQLWTGQGNAWTDAIAAGFTSYKLDAPGAKADPQVLAARKAFLASKAGIGIDVFFGGGSFDHDRMARQGLLVDSGLSKMHPDWLKPEVMPEKLGGETYYDKQGRWYGSCLTTFGICYNKDSLKRLGIKKAPTQWADLADPRYFKQIALADPTKSGSIGKAFEMLVQQQIRQEVDERKAEQIPDSSSVQTSAPGRPAVAGAPSGAAPGQAWDERAEKQAVAAGFDRAMRLIQQISGNSRYFADGASTVVSDVADGNAAAGMCIDYYGRFEAESIANPEGVSRLEFVAPVGGTSVSVDPVSVFRGAPNFEIARHFVEFVLSPEGQKIWDYKAGTPGGPIRYTLRRLPIRKDMYTPEDRRYMADPDAEPYELAAKMTYHPEWTASLFNFLRVYVQTLAIDPHDELQQAWGAICAAGGPAGAPEAANIFGQMPLAYEDAGKQNISDPVERMRLMRKWAIFFQEHYRAAQEAAEQERLATKEAHHG